MSTVKLRATTAKQRDTPQQSKSAPSQRNANKMPASNVEWRLFSENPDKAWAEKFFLAYSLVWPLLFAGYGISGLFLHIGDLGNILVTSLIGSPNILVPLAFCPTKVSSITETYWFKFTSWIAIYSFAASYFFSEYFFDVLGMIYSFPNMKWNLDSIHVGSGKQVVPLMMYIHAWYFFITYHTCSIIFIRAFYTSPLFRSIPFIKQLSIAFTAWLFSWGEIYFTTMEAIRDHFTYRDMDWALTKGALVYSCYFVSSFPMVFNLDETVKDKWTLTKTLENSLAASMISFFLLDIGCQFVITEWATG